MPHARYAILNNAFSTIAYTSTTIELKPDIQVEVCDRAGEAMLLDSHLNQLEICAATIAELRHGPFGWNVSHFR